MIVLLYIGFAVSLFINILYFIREKNSPKELIWADNAQWDVTNLTDFGEYVSKEASIYKIYRIGNRYILQCSGHKPETHPYYKEVVAKFNQMKLSRQ